MSTGAITDPLTPERLDRIAEQASLMAKALRDGTLVHVRIAITPDGELEYEMATADLLPTQMPDPPAGHG